MWASTVVHETGPREILVCCKRDKFKLKLLVRGENYEAETCLFRFFSPWKFWRFRLQLTGLNCFKKNETDYRNKDVQSFLNLSSWVNDILLIKVLYIQTFDIMCVSIFLQTRFLQKFGFF